MKQKKDNKVFVPLTHEDVDTKNSLLNTARELASKEGIENVISSTMIYAGMTEYLAQHLLSNLRYFAYDTTHANSGAIMYIDQRNKRQRKGLGETIENLKDYEFPDKKKVLNLLIDFNRSRTHFFHEFVAINDSNVSEYQDDIQTIAKCTEELVNLLNVIYAGMGRIMIPQPIQDDKNK